MMMIIIIVWARENTLFKNLSYFLFFCVGRSLYILLHSRIAVSCRLIYRSTELPFHQAHCSIFALIWFGFSFHFAIADGDHKIENCFGKYSRLDRWINLGTALWRGTSAVASDFIFCFIPVAHAHCSPSSILRPVVVIVHVLFWLLLKQKQLGWMLILLVDEAVRSLFL